MEPLAEQGLLALVQRRAASGRLLGQEPFNAVLLKRMLPPRLRNYGMPERTGDLLLGSQFRLPQVDGDLPQMNGIGQSNPVDRHLPAKDDPVSVPVDEVHGLIDRSAVTERRLYQGQFTLDRCMCVHITMNTTRRKKFRDNLSLFPPTCPGQNWRKPAE